MIIDLRKILFDGAILSLVASAFLIITLRINPRLWLQDYPQDIQDQVPPKTEQELRLSLILGIPFLLVLFGAPLISTLGLKRQYAGDVAFLALTLHAFGVGFIFNVVDWLLIDWLLFCVITPEFLIIPGTEGAGGYTTKNYGHHVRGFVIGTGVSLAGGLVIAAIVSLL
jgi:hypothetical protein